MQKEILNLYKNAINEIDDYFEYSHDSEKDKEHVMNIIDKMTLNLEKLQFEYKFKTHSARPLNLGPNTWQNNTE